MVGHGQGHHGRGRQPGGQQGTPPNCPDDSRPRLHQLSSSSSAASRSPLPPDGHLRAPTGHAYAPHPRPSRGYQRAVAPLAGAGGVAGRLGGWHMRSTALCPEQGSLELEVRWRQLRAAVRQDEHSTCTHTHRHRRSTSRAASPHHASRAGAARGTASAKFSATRGWKQQRVQGGRGAHRLSGRRGGRGRGRALRLRPRGRCSPSRG